MRGYIFTAIFVYVSLLVGQMVTNADVPTLINGSFYYGLISLTIGACFYILHTGFLDLFLEGFKKLSTVITPKSRSLERTDEKLKEDASLRLWKQSVFKNAELLFLGIGSGMTLFSLTALFIVG